jgi:two-component system, chemotaxis family, chemotaxis protein CheY
MKTLIVEDDFTCRLLLQEILKRYGPVHVAVNGEEAVMAFRKALDADERYDLVCMDIMMPEMDGQQALSELRAMEQERGINYEVGVKIIMTTALSDMSNVMGAFGSLCDAYLLKPIHKEALLDELRTLKLIE